MHGTLLNAFLPAPTHLRGHTTAGGSLRGRRVDGARPALLGLLACALHAMAAGCAARVSVMLSSAVA